LALIEYIRGNYGFAAEMFKKTRESIPEDPSYILMEGISMYADGDKEGGIAVIRSSMDNMPRDGYFYDIARMYAEPGYDSYLVSKLTRETKLPLKSRVLFYVATYYKLMGNTRLANIYFLEVADANIFGMFETDLAEYELKDKLID